MLWYINAEKMVKIRFKQYISFVQAYIDCAYNQKLITKQK